MLSYFIASNAEAYTYNFPFIIKEENEHEVLVICARSKTEAKKKFSSI